MHRIVYVIDNKHTTNLEQHFYFRYIVPTAILVKFSTTHLITSYSSFNQSSFFANTLLTTSYNFGVYQQTAIGVTDATVRTLVLIIINADVYRNALITVCFLSDSS